MFRETSISAFLLFLTSTANASAFPAWKRGAQQVTASVSKAQAFQAATALQKTSNYVTIQRSTIPSKHLPLLKELQKKEGLEGTFTVDATAPSTTLIPGLGGEEYLVQIEWAGTPVDVILDTGSSDTWLIQSGFKCVTASGASTSESTCNFGPPFSGSFNEGSIKNENFNISYGDGEYVNGVLGYEDITVAGITVSKQEAALGNYAYWNGDGTSSGLAGFAYPALTSAFAGTNPDQDSSRINYDPLFTSMYKQGLVSPSFSLAIQRGTSGGYLALGGLPPVNVDQNNFTSTPIQVLSLSGFPANTLTFYTVDVDGYTYNGKSSGSSQAIVDSGTTLVYAPTSVAKAVNNAFSPKAKYLSNEGAYFVDCKATAPNFGVTINGVTFSVSAQDLIFQDAVDQATGLCLTGVQDGGSGPYILGDVFMRNVVAVFDVGAGEMRFASYSY